MTPNEYCHKKALSAGSNLYYSLLQLSHEKRNAITAIHALRNETNAIITDCSDVSIAQPKLSWWRSEIDRCFNGQAQHPISKALYQPLQIWNLPQEYFHEMLDGVQMDLEQQHYHSFSEVALYHYRVSGTVSMLSAEILGYENRDTLKYAQTLGTALQLTRTLRDTRTHAQQSQLYIPMETLQQFDIKPEDLLSNSTTEKLTALFNCLLAQANEHYQQAFQQLPNQDRYAQCPGLIQAALYQTLLNEIKADGYQLLEQRVSLTPLRKFWIAWKTHRHEKNAHNKRR